MDNTVVHVGEVLLQNRDIFLPIASDFFIGTLMHLIVSYGNVIAWSDKFSLMFYFYQLNRKLMRTNPMLHTEPYINCFLITLGMHKLPQV